VTFHCLLLVNLFSVPIDETWLMILGWRGVQNRPWVLRTLIYEGFFFYPMPHMSLTDLVVFPPGDGRSVTDFSDWDAHEARLRCPDDVSGDIGGCSARRALKSNFN